MKRAALICPEHRDGIQEVIGGLPLVLAVYLGKPLIDHALYGLTRDGFDRVLVFVSDRPAEVRDYIGNGATWGLQVEVMPTPAEITAGEARLSHGMGDEEPVLLLDRLPQAPDIPILSNLESWHASRHTLLPLLVPRQIGTQEHSPGVWMGMKVRIAPTALIEAPAWIGHQSIIGDGARIGPHGFVENDSYVESHAEVTNSTVGARTYLGGMTHLTGSVACGSVLANWSNGSVFRLTDSFLLAPLDIDRKAASGYLARLLAAFILMVASPLIIVTRSAVLRVSPGAPLETVTYFECPFLPPVWSRWPRLWCIVTGHFSWTGNPPLDPEMADTMQTEFEQLWLHVPPALFTAPEAEGCTEPWDDEAKAHAALFASQPTFAWRCRILQHGLTSLFKHPSKTI
jgi:hypothetical protein